jgi:hypothetical protein
MSQTIATTGVASPGNTVGFSRGRKTTGEQVIGKEEKLGELVYKFNTKDKANMYLCTMEAIADFVGVEYGRDMRMLVKPKNNNRNKIVAHPTNHGNTHFGPTQQPTNNLGALV